MDTQWLSLDFVNSKNQHIQLAEYLLHILILWNNPTLLKFPKKEYIQLAEYAVFTHF